MTTQNPFSILLKLVEQNYEKLTTAREIFEVISNRMAVLDNPQELIAFLGQHLKPKELEKKQNGEVFTPPELIQQKFDQLTLADPTIWSDPSKKFLDPANGIGNYPALAYHRLMNGLAEVIPNEADRKRHILENMLYMCELTKKNVEVSRTIFDPEGIYALHIYQGSFFDLNTEDEWNVKKFDVVFGNPPYNAPNMDGKTTGNTIYPKFLIKIATLIKENGYQVLVHPGIWRKPGHKLHDLMFGRQLLYMEIHTKLEGIKLFGATTRYEWYIMKNCIPYTTTDIRFDDGMIEHINITIQLPCLVNHGFDIWNKVYQKSIIVGCLETYCGGSEQSSKCSKTMTHNYSYPFVNSTNKTKGVVSLWSKKQHPVQYEKKVIYSNNEVILPFYDTGRFGVTQQGLYHLVKSKEDGIKVCRFLCSKLIRYIIASSKWSMFRTEYETFRSIPLPYGLPDNFTDIEVYTYFGLTPEEIDRIEANQRGPGLTDYVVLEAPVVSVPPAPVVEVFVQPVDVDTTIQLDYNKMKVADLKQLCKDRKIKGITGKKKEDLIVMLTSHI